MAASGLSQPTAQRIVIARKIGAAGCGLFFIWVGVALLVSLGWGPGLLGVGIITLGGQIARRYVGLSFEPFWVLVAALFLLGRVWELVRVPIGLVPIWCIAVGVLPLFSVIVGRF